MFVHSVSLWLRQLRAKPMNSNAFEHVHALCGNIVIAFVVSLHVPIGVSMPPLQCIIV